tara:strand:+ start:443 stop:637 length:195 start_codon:yes stop_codon:yes gene_type:complete
MTKKISVQENAERAFLIEKMYQLDKRTNGLFCGLGEELETYRRIKNLKQDLKTYRKWKSLFANE